MTPEETKAMADRITKNRQEAARKAPKAVKIPVKDKDEPKTLPVKHVKVTRNEKPNGKPKVQAKATRKVKKDRVKPIGPGTLLFKFKDGAKSRKVCDVLKCNAKPTKGFRCNKHKKEIRKVQLAANNKVWKKRVKAGTAGHHVVYTRPGEKKAIATRYSLKATDKAVKVVSSGHSVIEKVGDFKKIVSRTKKERAA